MPLTPDEMALAEQIAGSADDSTKAQNAGLDEQEKLLARTVASAGATGAGSGVISKLGNAITEAPLLFQGGPTVGDLGTGIWNSPAAIKRLVGGLYDVAASPVQTGKALASTFGTAEGLKGLADDLRKFVTTTTPGEYLRKRTREDLPGLIMDLPLGLGGSAVASRMGKLGELSKAAKSLERAGDFVNPVRRGLQATEAIASKGGRLSRRLIEEMSGFFSRRGRLPYQRTFQSAAESAVDAADLPETATKIERFKAMARPADDIAEVRAGRRGLVADEELATEATEAARRIKDLRDDAFSQRVKNLELKDPNVPLNATEMKRELPGILEDFGIGLEGKDTLEKLTSLGMTARPESANIRNVLKLEFPRHFSKAERAQVSRIVNEIMSVDSNNIDEFLSLRRQIRKANDKAKFIGNTTSSNVLANLEDAVTNQLKSKVSGFVEMNAEFADQTRFLESMQRGLGVGTQNNELIVRRLLDALTERQGMDWKRKLIEQMEEVSGSPIISRASGVSTRTPIPQGLWGPGFAAMSAAGGMFTNPAFWTVLPFTSPRLMGSVMDALGTSKRYARAVEDFMGQLQKQVARKGMMTDGLTVGMVLDRLSGQEGEEKPPSVIQSIGRAAMAFGTKARPLEQ